MRNINCKNCKWYQIGFFHEECWINHVYYKTNQLHPEYPNIIYQDYLHLLERDIKLNKNNNCRYYKKKHWWKFWL